jgi:hypothetical protein
MLGCSSGSLELSFTSPFWDRGRINSTIVVIGLPVWGVALCQLKASANIGTLKLCWLDCNYINGKCSYKSTSK